MGGRTGSNADYSRRAKKARKKSPWSRGPMCETKRAKRLWRENERKDDEPAT